MLPGSKSIKSDIIGEYETDDNNSLWSTDIILTKLIMYLSHTVSYLFSYLWVTMLLMITIQMYVSLDGIIDGLDGLW